MGKKQNGSTVNWKAQSILKSLQSTTDDDLLLQRYRKLCHFVGDDVADRVLDKSTRKAIKKVHDNKYHPKTNEKLKGGELVGQRQLRARTA